MSNFLRLLFLTVLLFATFSNAQKRKIDPQAREQIEDRNKGQKNTNGRRLLPELVPKNTRKPTKIIPPPNRQADYPYPLSILSSTSSLSSLGGVTEVPTNYGCFIQNLEKGQRIFKNKYNYDLPAAKLITKQAVAGQKFKIFYDISEDNDEEENSVEEEDFEFLVMQFVCQPWKKEQVPKFEFVKKTIQYL